MPPSYIRIRAVVWAYGRGQTDTQTRVTTIHFASSTTHAKCNNTTTPTMIMLYDEDQLDHMQIMCTSLQITTPAHHHSIFTGWMLFLTPNSL